MVGGTKERERGGIQSLERAFAILEAIAAHRDGIALADLCKHVGLHSSTTFHLVKTLVQLGPDVKLEADRAFAGTVVSGPGYTHRFNADRTCIRIDFDGSGQMNVESLAA